MSTLRQFCPAKINPYLAVTGRRDDGFHELVSLVLPLPVGDVLEVSLREEPGFSLRCDDPGLPVDENNLVLQAARHFAAAAAWDGGASFVLQKKLPVGAGLGGGSSDAVGALRALNALAGEPLDGAQLAEVAAQVGSDCPLFLADGPVIMRGRGELVEPLAPELAARFAGRHLVVCKPPFGINTAWAYGRLAAGAPESYLSEQQAEERLVTLGSREGFNSFWPVVAQKYPAVAVLQGILCDEMGLELHLSGSGSACFVWVDSTAEAARVEALVRTSWGPGSWVRSVF